MLFLNRAKGIGLRMLGFGFAGDSSNDEEDKENQSESSTSTPPWVKKQKVRPGKHETEHISLVRTISDQLLKYRTPRALNTMKSLPNFDQDFQNFVREQCRVEGDKILLLKDPSVNEFNLDSLKAFNYNDELNKLEHVAPTLMASIAGSISGSKQTSISSLSRKGFGGSRRSEDISLVPAMVQCATMIMKNRHPNSISTVPCVNSLNNWVNHIPHKYFYLTNSLGISLSKQTTVKLVDNVNKDYDLKIVDMKNKIEMLHISETTNRGLRSRASDGVGGFALFGDNVGKIVNPRFNTGLTNKGEYLQMALTLGIINRVPSAHLGVKPLLSPGEVNYFPTQEDIFRMKGWMKYKIGKLICEHHPAFSDCGKYIEHPPITFPAAKRSRSDFSLVSLSLDDPASHDGMIRISEKLIKYIPELPTGSRQKTVVFGDQLYVERGHSASWGRCGEKNSISKLEGLIFIPQEWHKKQEDLIIYNKRFNISHQVDCPGTLQNVKCSFGHNKASKDVSNYHASFDLAEVTTCINLISLVCHLTGLGYDAPVNRCSQQEFKAITDRVLHEIDLFSKWEEDSQMVVEDNLETDYKANFHKDLTFYGLLLLSQKSSSQFGDGEGAVAFWKNSMADYHDESKPKYRICAHRKVAAAAGVFGAKVQTDVIHNCFVNDKGREDSNVEGDLKVEHVNRDFKAGLMHLCGNYTEESLQRVAKSLVITECLEDKLYPAMMDSDVPLHKEKQGHRIADWSDQVKKGVEELCHMGVFEHVPGREMPGVKNYDRNNKVDFKGLKRHIKRYNKELQYYILDTFKAEQ